LGHVAWLALVENLIEAERFRRRRCPNGKEDQEDERHRSGEEDASGHDFGR
jgi:hypothetical protein